MSVKRFHSVEVKTISPMLRSSLPVLFLFLLYPAAAVGQESAGKSRSGVSSQGEPAPMPAMTPLENLLREAEQNNPSIRAARQEWQAAQQVPTQVSTLPDPQFLVQHSSVGSPRPFAGFTNSDMAYLGLGVSQDIPYPGKLRLRGEIAKREADVLQQRYESTRRSVLAAAKSAYFQLGYLSRTLSILESNGELLNQAEQAADARYRSGMGNQHDLLQAQLERTKLLREITMNHLAVAKLQAQFKQLLNRPQSSPDIEPTEPPETPLEYSFEELLSAAKTHNPELAGAETMVAKQTLQRNLAQKDFYPDFNVQYLWQRTDPMKFRANYMLSFGIRIPIYRGRKQNPELAQAEIELNQSRSEFEAQTQQIAFDLRTEYEITQKNAELLNIYREGLLPQARGAFESGVAAYQNNRQDFQALLAALLDVQRLEEEYWQSLAERATALARMEELTGLSLLEERAK